MAKSYEIISYPRQRAILSFVVSEIQEEFSKKYKANEDVSLEFLKAFFTGYLLPIARLVETTFGKGSFRVLGMMGDDKETPITVWEYLEKSAHSSIKIKEKIKHDYLRSKRFQYQKNDFFIHDFFNRGYRLSAGFFRECTGTPPFWFLPCFSVF